MNISKPSPSEGSSSSSYTSFQMPGIVRTQDCHKTNDRFGASSCGFLPFLCKILHPPRYPHRHLFSSPKISFWSLPSRFWMLPLGPLSDLYFSLSFFSSVPTWMSFAITQGKEGFVRGLLHSREEFLSDYKPSLPITQWAVATKSSLQQVQWLTRSQQAGFVHQSFPATTSKHSNHCRD